MLVPKLRGSVPPCRKNYSSTLAHSLLHRFSTKPLRFSSTSTSALKSSFPSSHEHLQTLASLQAHVEQPTAYPSLETREAPQTVPTKDALNYNHSITSLVRAQEYKRAASIFQEMKQKGIEPDATSFTAAVHAFAMLRDTSSALECIADMRQRGIPLQDAPFTALLEAFSLRKDTDGLFEFIRQQRALGTEVTRVHLSAAMRNMPRHPSPQLVVDKFNELAKICGSDMEYHVAVLNFLGRSNCATDALEKYWRDMQLSGAQPNQHVFSALVRAALICNDVESAERYLVEMFRRGFTENILQPFNFFGQSQRPHKVLEIFERSGISYQEYVANTRFTLFVLEAALQAGNWQHTQGFVGALMAAGSLIPPAILDQLLPLYASANDTTGIRLVLAQYPRSNANPAYGASITVVEAAARAKDLALLQEMVAQLQDHHTFVNLQGCRCIRAAFVTCNNGLFDALKYTLFLQSIPSKKPWFAVQLLILEPNSVVASKSLPMLQLLLDDGFQFSANHVQIIIPSLCKGNDPRLLVEFLEMYLKKHPHSVKVLGTTFQSMMNLVDKSVLFECVALLQQCGFQLSQTHYNRVIQAYAIADKWEGVEELVHKMKLDMNQDEAIRILNDVLTTLRHPEQLAIARRLYEQFVDAGLEPNLVTFKIALSLCVGAENRAAGQYYMAQMKKHGVEPDASATALQNALNRRVEGEEDVAAMAALMADDSIKLGARAITTLSRLFAAKQQAQLLKPLMSKLEKAGFQETTARPIVACFGRLGDAAGLDEVVSKLPRTLSDRTYHTIMAAYLNVKNAPKVLHYFQRMKNAGLEVNAQAYARAMNACLHAGEFAKATQLYEEMRDQNIPPSKAAYTAAFNIFVKRGDKTKMEECAAVLQTLVDSTEMQTLEDQATEMEASSM